MTLQLTFLKTGQEIRQAVQHRIAHLQERLDRLNTSLDTFLADRKKVRSYLVRSAPPQWGGHARVDNRSLYTQDEISSEEKEEISQLCRRIFEIEQELHRLRMVATHLRDDQSFELPFEDLVAYGFEARLESEQG
ncbi:MAG: hypothetical protein U0Q55_20040 [Vicinamibacterales bacterium]